MCILNTNHKNSQVHTAVKVLTVKTQKKQLKKNKIFAYGRTNLHIF